MVSFRNILFIMAGLLIVIGLLGWLGLQIQPKPFPSVPDHTQTLKTVPLPAGLPVPVERFYKIVYGEEIPVIETVVIQGRGILKPSMNIPLPARFVFVHTAGKDYRHYFEATLFGIPLLKVNEGYIDGASFFESPMGNFTNDPNSNQGANLALWAEAGWFPSIWITDPRVRWVPVDDQTALLSVTYQDQMETFVVRFDPKTGLIDMMEAMRFRNPDDQSKILWITRYEPGPKLPGSVLNATGSATWLDQGKPWAYFTVEDVQYNVDVSTYIRQSGY